MCRRDRLPTTGVKAELQARLQISSRFAYKLLKWPAAAATPQLGEGLVQAGGREASMQTEAEIADLEVSGFTLDWLTIEQLKELCRRDRLLSQA